MNENNEKRSSVLARVYFHDLPDEQDYEVHDEKHMSGVCDGCVPAYIVPRTAWDDAKALIAHRDVRIEELERWQEAVRDGSQLLNRLEAAERELAALKSRPADSYGGEFSKGDIGKVGDCDKFEAGIHHLTFDACDMVFDGKIVRTGSTPGTWFQRIAVYGSTAEQAESLRDFVLSRISRQAGGVVPELIAQLVDEIERNTCMHENTHRGGAIWEICDDCGAQWSDDRNPRPEFKWPDCVVKANEFLGHLNSSPVSVGAVDEPFMWVRVENDCIEDYTQDKELAAFWMQEQWPVTFPLYRAALNAGSAVPDRSEQVRHMVPKPLHELRIAYQLSSAGQYDSGAPEHRQTIAIQELIELLDFDEQEPAWETIRAYADMRAVDALFRTIEILGGLAPGSDGGDV